MPRAASFSCCARDLFRSPAIHAASILALLADHWLRLAAGSGMEATMAAFFALLLGLSLIRNRAPADLQLAGYGALCGLLMLTRPEFFVAPAIMLFAPRGRTIAGWLRGYAILLAAFAAVVSPWFAYAIAHFGSAVPNTVALKVAAPAAALIPPVANIVLAVKRQAQFFGLMYPERLVIDIPDATLRGRLPPAPGDHPTLAGLRSGVRAGDDLRMVLDIKQAVRTKTFLRKPDAEGGHRLVIDLIPTAPSAPPPAKTRAPKDAQKAKAPEGQGTETQVKAAEPKVLETKSARTKGGKTKGRTLVIAIDPGHGGKDPGAIGPKGTREKDITLAIAKRLAALVAKEPGMRPYLTRDRDVFVPLRKRMSKARAEGTDLFISIHADAFEDAAVRGSAVFTLSPRGASSEAAKWLADRENAVDLVGGVDLGEADNVLATVLLDMSQNATMEHSGVAAQMVLDKLQGVGPVHQRRVQRAGFVVLKSPDIPSLLVEAAFISNPDEEARLTNPTQQQRLAEAVLRGIKAYFRKHPVPGAALANDDDEGKQGSGNKRVAGSG